MNTKNVEYEMVALPSKGECYKSKKSELTVAPLLANDEDIIVSHSLRKSNRMADMLLDGKILDDDINPMDLCVGDRQAILLHLRKNTYGSHLKYFNRFGEKKEIDLNNVKYKKFELIGDEDGHFIYEWKGSVIKHRMLTRRDELVISDFTERLNDEVVNGKDMTTEDYYRTVIIEILGTEIISVDGNGDIDGWIKDKSTDDLNEIYNYFRKVSPGIDSDLFSELNVAESIFYDIS